MTEAPNSFGPGTSDPSKRALAAIVAVFVLIDACGTWLWWNSGHDLLEILSYVLLTYQPMAFGIWAALGGGSILSRVAVTIPCLMLVFVAPGYVPTGYADVSQAEFAVFVVMGYVIYFATLLVALTFRWITGLRILSRQELQTASRFVPKFDLKSLLMLTTLYAVALGMMMHMHFHAESSTAYLGGDPFLHFIVIAASYLWVIVLTAIPVPLAILYGGATMKAVVPAAVFWGFVTVTLFLTMEDSHGPVHLFTAIVFTQVAAAALGACTAIVLRLGGARLVKYEQPFGLFRMAS